MASSNDVKLIGIWSSPVVIRARVALNLKGVEYEFLEEDLNNKSELLLKSNPVYKKVPVLIHNGKPVCESLVIVNYIDDVWPSSGLGALLPVDPYDRATTRFWASYIDDKLFNGLRGVAFGQTEEVRAEAAEQLQLGLQVLEEAFEKCSNGKAFFNGDTIGYVDIALGSFLPWLKVVEKTSSIKFLGGDKTPMLEEWAERFCSDEIVKELIPDTDRLVEYGKMLQAKHREAPATTN